MDKFMLVMLVELCIPSSVFGEASLFGLQTDQAGLTFCTMILGSIALTGGILRRSRSLVWVIVCSSSKHVTPFITLCFTIF